MTVPRPESDKPPEDVTPIWCAGCRRAVFTPISREHAERLRSLHDTTDVLCWTCRTRNT